jgi:hypothetical protein
MFVITTTAIIKMTASMNRPLSIFSVFKDTAAHLGMADPLLARHARSKF